MSIFSNDVFSGELNFKGGWPPSRLRPQQRHLLSLGPCSVQAADSFMVLNVKITGPLKHTTKTNAEPGRKHFLLLKKASTFFINSSQMKSVPTSIKDHSFRQPIFFRSDLIYLHPSECFAKSSCFSNIGHFCIAEML